MKRLIFGLVATALLLTGVRQSSAGAIFLTGHDPDFHAYQGGNTTGAQDLTNDAIKFITGGIAAPNLLLVTDLSDPGGGYSDPRLGLTAGGLTYSVADYGSGASGVLDLNTVNFSNYDGIIIASDFGGWLRQRELDILNARSGDIINYLNNGGGLYAMAESSSPYGLTTGGDFGFLPFVVASAALNQSEIGNTVTPFGASLGLSNSDINGNASHNIFNGTFGLNIVDYDSSGDILSLAGSGTVTTVGVTPVPEPSTLVMWSLIGSVFGVAWVGRQIRQPALAA